MALASGFTYDAPIIANGYFEDVLSGEVDSYTVTIGEYKIEPLYSDYYFIDENNQIYDLNTPTSRATCEHNYVSGSITRHIKKSNGSCTMKTYNAKVCTLCQDAKDKKLTETRTFEECPH